MRLLAACSLGGSGHLNPLLAFLDAAAARGDDTLVVGPPALGPLVASTGHRFRAGGEPSEDTVAAIRERLPVVPASEASILGDRELFGRLATEAMLSEMERVVADWEPDVVLREPCEYASAVVALRTGTPVAQVAISLSQAEAGAITTAAPALSEHHPDLECSLRATPYLTRFPASLDPPAFPTTVRYREPTSGTGRPLPDWWDGDDRPLVYMTFGSVLGYLSSADAVYRCAVEAAASLSARVLLTVGRRFDPDELGPLPGHVHVEPWVAQADVLPSASAVVCHGGSGTVLGALATGVPVVIVPMFADQFVNGRRVAAAGAGRTVDDRRPHPGGGRRPPDVSDAPAVADAADDVLTDPAYRRQARAVAAEIAAAPTASATLDGLAGAR